MPLNSAGITEREELVAAIRQELAETETQLAALLARRSELNELLAHNALPTWLGLLLGFEHR